MLTFGDFLVGETAKMKINHGTGHGKRRTFGPEKNRSLSVRPKFYLSGPSDRRHLGKTAKFFRDCHFHRILPRKHSSTVNIKNPIH